MVRIEIDWQAYLGLLEMGGSVALFFYTFFLLRSAYKAGSWVTVVGGIVSVLLWSASLWLFQDGWARQVAAVLREFGEILNK